MKKPDKQDELRGSHRILRIGDDPGPGNDGGAETDGDVGTGSDTSVLVVVMMAIVGLRRKLEEAPIDFF